MSYLDHTFEYLSSISVFVLSQSKQKLSTGTDRRKNHVQRGWEFINYSRKSTIRTTSNENTKNYPGTTIFVFYYLKNLNYSLSNRKLIIKARTS